jgi:PPP family 3-phenylpropionic acid transporter
LEEPGSGGQRTRGGGEGRAFAVPVALFYGALFVVYGTNIPFMPVWLDWCGLTAGEISIVMAAPLFLRLLVTPAVAVAADRGGTHRRYLVALSWLSLAFVLALAAAGSFWPILILATLFMVSNSTIMPLIETIAIEAMRLGGLDYGRVRLWGSLSFVAASFLGGIAMTSFGAGAGVWLIAFGSALTVAAGHLLPKPEARTLQAARGATAEPTVADEVLAEAAGAPIRSVSEPLALLSLREFRLFLIAAGLAQAAHAAFFTFGVLLWQKQGYSATWCGTLWAIGVFAEVLLFLVSGRVVPRVGAARLIAIGAAASIGRWVAFAFEPSLAALIPLQILHGATYGATHVGAMHFIHDAVPRDKAGSAQALYATVSAGVAMGCATLIAGWVYASAGSYCYLAMAAFAAVALVAALRLARIWDGGMLGVSRPAA